MSSQSSGLYKILKNGITEEIKSEEFSKEEEIEDLIEKNPRIIMNGAPLLLIGRQVKTGYKTKLDLLGLTASGNTVIVELKKGKTPRDVFTQIMEYAVWVQKLGYQQLNTIAQKYKKISSLREYYMEYFGEHGLLENIIENVNQEQMLVILAKEIDEKLEDITRYLREKGIRLRCLKYSYFLGESGEKYLHIDTVVGKEPIKGTGPELPPVSEIYEAIIKAVESIDSQDFTAPDVYQKFNEMYPQIMANLELRYRNTPQYSPKTLIAGNLATYSKRSYAPFTATDKMTQAPDDWGYPQVRLYRKK